MIVDLLGVFGATGALEGCVAGTALGDALGDGDVAGAGASWESLTWMIGDENWKLLAVNESQPSFSFAIVVATSFDPSEDSTEIDAFIGALVNP